MKLWKLMENGIKHYPPTYQSCYIEMVDGKQCGCALGTLYLEFGAGKIKTELDLPFYDPKYKPLTKSLLAFHVDADMAYRHSTAWDNGMQENTVGGMIEYMFEVEGLSREEIVSWLKERNL